MNIKKLLAVVAVSLLALPGTVSAQTPAGADTLSVEQMVQVGWEAARSDRHAEAVGLFQRAMEREPARRRELLLETAVRMTYSGRAPEAVPLYQEVLGWQDLRPEERQRAQNFLALSLSWSGRLGEALTEYRTLVAGDPANVEARLGSARVSSWTGRLGSARAGYQAVLAQDPQNREARRGLAQVSIWSGRQRQGLRRIQEYLREHPDDIDARYIMAEAYAGMGRPDRATAIAQEILAQNPAHQPSAILLGNLRLQRRPVARVDLQHTNRSDNLDFVTLTTSQGFPTNRGLTTVEALFQRYDYYPEDPRLAVAVNRPGLSVRHRVSDWSEVALAPHLIAIDPGGSNNGREVFGYDARATFWSGDMFRVDLLSTRTLFYDDVLSVQPAITITYGGGTVEFLPDPYTRATVRATQGNISDGNRRTWVQADGERRILSRPVVVLLGGQYTSFGFAERSTNGYFSPDNYWSGAGTAKAFGNLKQRVFWGLESSYGTEATDDNARAGFWSAGARANYRLSRRVELEGRYLIFNSRRFFSATQPGNQSFRLGMGGVGLRVAW